MVTLKNVVLVGASGSLGMPVLNALVKAKFNVTVVKRDSSAATFPNSVKVVTADFSSVESVTEAFKGHDAVVSTVGVPGIPGQGILVDAAVAAGIKRFLPSDFGCDIANPKGGVLPAYKNKVIIHNKLRDAAAANPDFTYTFVCTNALLDWGLKMNVLLAWKEGKPKFFDGGSSMFSATTFETAAEAVAGILNHPDETKNRFVYVKDLDISQARLLEIAKKIDPAKQWEEPINISTAEMEKSSNESLAKGQVSPMIMAAYILRIVFGPPEYGGRFDKVDNELLGLNAKTEADVETMLKGLMLG